MLDRGRDAMLGVSLGGLSLRASSMSSTEAPLSRFSSEAFLIIVHWVILSGIRHASPSG